ncbi:MAG TPA: DoxX family membrane protein [Pyrinomonadaceae bacterium]
MAPLIFLLATFTVLFLVNKYVLGKHLSLSLIGRVSMAMMLLVTGISHFTNTAEMVEMMPDFMPAKRGIVYLTGVIELMAVVGLLWDRTTRLASILLIIFFICVLPANIAGSLKSVQYGGMEYGPWYLLFRIPLQIFFIWWVWYFGVKNAETVTGVGRKR